MFGVVIPKNSKARVSVCVGGGKEDVCVCIYMCVCVREGMCVSGNDIYNSTYTHTHTHHYGIKNTRKNRDKHNKHTHPSTHTHTHTHTPPQPQPHTHTIREISAFITSYSSQINKVTGRRSTSKKEDITLRIQHEAINPNIILTNTTIDEPRYKNN